MDTLKKIKELEHEIYSKKKELAEYKKLNFPAQEIVDYTFQDFGGQYVDLISLFCDKNELIVIHNMRRECPNCTMWADGFNGIFKYIENRAPFVVISEDDYKVQKDFAFKRGWNFKMVSSKNTCFFRDMGFKSDDGELHPGISIFSKSQDNKIHRTNAANLGPYDDFCSVWHFLAML